MPASPDSSESRSVVIAATAERHDPWASEVVRLFTTVRFFGGSLANARCLVYFVRCEECDPPTAFEDVEPAVLSALADLGVELVASERVHPIFPNANKLVMFDNADDDSWLLALDTDTIVTGDMGNELRGEEIRARVVDWDPIGLAGEWGSLFEFFGLQMGPERLRTTIMDNPTIDYYNSGVMFMPPGVSKRLITAWRHYLFELPRALDALPRVRAEFRYPDQTALALALAATGIAVDPLPPDINTPTHVTIHERLGPATIQPRLVHYHHLVQDDGRFVRTGLPGIDARLEAVERNEALLANLRSSAAR